MNSLYRDAISELGSVVDRIDDSAVDTACAMIGAAGTTVLYGLGREGLRYAMDDMTEIRIMVLAWPQ